MAQAGRSFLPLIDLSATRQQTTNLGSILWFEMRRQPKSIPTPDLLRSVVKVLTVSDDPDYDQPWQTRGPSSSTGSGAIVKTKRGLRVLTNAHVVQNQVFVEVRRHGLSEKYAAEVEGVGHECDLALLRVDNREFFAGAKAIPLGKLPALSEHVSVLGYPIGGERLSVTQGVLSRIEVTSYAQSQRRLLAGQIDAAINAGNSGGPVVRNGRLVGVAFQSLEEGENIGYMIAEPVVRHFLDDLDDGRFDGFPDLGAVTRNLESEAHRRSLGLTEPHGVLVSDVVYGGSGWGALKRGDVLLEVDGTKIAADGTVPFPRGSRIDYAYVVSLHHVGDRLDLKVWRDHRTVNLNVELVQPQHLVAEDRYDVKPTYYIFGGLLFVPLTRDYLKTWGQHWWAHAPHPLMAKYETSIRTPAQHEVVVLQKVLADPVNLGYHDLESVEVVRVQGKAIRGLDDLIRAVETDTSEFLSFETADGSVVVLNREQSIARLPHIMRRFGVPRDRSADLNGKRPSPQEAPKLAKAAARRPSRHPLAKTRRRPSKPPPKRRAPRSA
ncbi:MAG TPA: trypsin-like peptidase domain-containing protein [Polyangiaceae bacterium]